MSGVRVALRIARRDALRAKGRSALVVAMVGVPMFALAFADVAVRTAEPSGDERARRAIGTADLVADFVSGGPIRQHGLYGISGDAQPIVRGDGGVRAPDAAPDVRAVLPRGSRAIPWRSFYAVRLAAGDRVVNGQVAELDLRDPLAAGIARLHEGALPVAAGEAALTRNLARLLGARLGDVVTVPDVMSFRVSGVVVEPASLGARTLYVAAPTRLPASSGRDEPVQRRWAVDLPPGADAVALVPALNEHGFRVSPRAWVIDPPAEPGSGGVGAEEVGVGIVVVGLAALEVVLLAGAAFAVGARRRRRELALVAATGGDGGDVRRVVLAGGVVLGAVAGAAGVLGGIAAVVALRPWLERAAGSELGPLDVRPLELAAIVALGAGTALLAAVLPARAAARQPVVAALTGRRGDARLRKRVPVLAVAAIACGAALAFWGAGTGNVADGGRRANFTLVLVGAVVAELGFVASAPALVTLAGTAASRLPLSLRLAARDAARHRTRSGPAVAAVVAAVAGSVAMSVYLASDTERQRRDYRPFAVEGNVRIGRETGSGPVPQSDVDAAVARLPVRERIDSHAVAEECRDPEMPCGSWQLELPKEHDCAPGDIGCARRMPTMGGLVAGSVALVEWSTGEQDARAEAALRDGRLVVFDERWIVDGRVTIARERFAGDRRLRTERIAVPAVAVRGAPIGERPVGVLTPETARRYGLPLVPGSTLLLTSRMPTEAEEAQARGALLRSRALFPDIYVERGFRAENDIAVLALALAAGVVTLAATAIATGLAAADSRPDLATLAAVGAAPRIRRRLVVAQAATVAALGSALGLLAGLVPAVAVVSARHELPLVLPWRSFGVSAVLVPLLAAVAVGAFTRARLPLERRLA